jgi:hypothetical protein
VTDASPPSTHQTRTVGGFDTGGRLWVIAVFGLGGAALGALLPVLARWAAELPWVPFQGPLRLLGSFDEPWLTWGRPAIGLAAGLALAAWIILDAVVLEIGLDRIEVRRRGQVERVIDRGTVAAVHPKRSKIVIETESGRTLFDHDIEGDRTAVRSAFVDLGYPWEGPRD